MVKERKIKQHVTNESYQEWSDKHGKFLHWCPDWDFLLISSEDPEFLACTCTFKDESGREELIAELEKIHHTAPEKDL